MKLKIYLFLILFLLFIGTEMKIQAQSAASFCQPTTGEILFTINPIENWNPVFDGILVAGELKTVGVVEISEKSISVMQLTTMVSGILETAEQPVYLIRQSNGKTRDKIRIDLNKIKTGEAADINLKKGNILFVSRGCAKGKLLPMTKPMLSLQPREPRGVDAPSGFRVPIF